VYILRRVRPRSETLDDGLHHRNRIAFLTERVGTRISRDGRRVQTNGTRVAATSVRLRRPVGHDVRLKQRANDHHRRQQRKSKSPEKTPGNELLFVFPSVTPNETRDRHINAEFNRSNLHPVSNRHRLHWKVVVVVVRHVLGCGTILPGRFRCGRDGVAHLK